MVPTTAPRNSTARATTSTSKSSSSLPNPTLPQTTTKSSTDINTLPNASIEPTTSQTSGSKKRKRKRKEKPHVVHQCTFGKPAWTYFHLSLTTPSPAIPSTSQSLDQISTSAATISLNSHAQPSPSSAGEKDMDALTTLTLLTPALTAYLGLTGSSIPIDILHTKGRDVWIRMPRRDARGLRASLMGWVGSCGADLVPGVRDGEGRVKVAWRVVGEAGSLACIGMGEGESGGGRELFGE